MEKEIKEDLQIGNTEPLVKIKRQQWKKEYDEVIIECVKKTPTNITYALNSASKQLHKTFGCVSGRYYLKLGKDPKIAAITCGSAKGFTQNVKNMHRNDDGSMPEQNLKGFMFVMREMLDLSQAERKKIIEFFK